MIAAAARADRMLGPLAALALSQRDLRSRRLSRLKPPRLPVQNSMQRPTSWEPTQNSLRRSRVAWLLRPASGPCSLPCRSNSSSSRLARAAVCLTQRQRRAQRVEITMSAVWSPFLTIVRVCRSCQQVWAALHVKAKIDDIPVLHDVFLALEPGETFFAGGFA